MKKQPAKRNAILLVDDEKKLLDLVSFRLRRLGYDVVTATTGEEALVVVETYAPDLVILDITMPGMDGIAVCARLKATPKFAALPILMLTARSGVEYVNRAIAAGADDYVVKPFDPAVLEMKVRRYIGVQEQSAAGKRGSE